MYEVGWAPLPRTGGPADRGLNGICVFTESEVWGSQQLLWLVSLFNNVTQDPALSRLRLGPAWLIYWLCLLVIGPHGHKTAATALHNIFLFKVGEVEGAVHPLLVTYPRSHPGAYVSWPKHGSHGHPKLWVGLRKMGGFPVSVVGDGKGNRLWVVST